MNPQTGVIAFTAASRRATADSSRTQPKYNNRLTLGIHSVPAHRQHPQHAHQHHEPPPLAYFDADEVALLAASRGSGSGSNSERKQAQPPPSSAASSALPRHPSHSSLDGRLHAPDVSVLSATAAPQRVLSLTRSRLDKSVSAASLSGLEELDDSGSGTAQNGVGGGAASAAGGQQQAATSMSVLQATRSRSSARRPLGASPVPAELAQLPELDPLELPAAVLALSASEPRRAQVSTTPQQQQQQQLQPSPLAASASFSAVSSPSPQSAFFTISASSGDPPPQQRGRPAGSAWGALSSRSEPSSDGLPSVGPLLSSADAAARAQALPAAASATVLNSGSGGSPSASPAAASASVVPGRVTVVRGSGAVASAPGAAGRDRTQPADPSAAKNGCCAVM